MVSFTTLLALSAGALAAPSVPTPLAEIPPNWTWTVDAWSAGCARSGCYYDFNVTVPSVGDELNGVKAYCSGYENGWYRKGNWFQDCQILEGYRNGVTNLISAKFSERTSDTDSSPDEIVLSFAKVPYKPRNEPGYNFTGSHEAIYNQFVAPLQLFNVTPTVMTVLV